MSNQSFSIARLFGHSADAVKNRPIDRALIAFFRSHRSLFIHGWRPMPDCSTRFSNILNRANEILSLVEQLGALPKQFLGNQPSRPFDWNYLSIGLHTMLIVRASRQEQPAPTWANFYETPSALTRLLTFPHEFDDTKSIANHDFRKFADFHTLQQRQSVSDFSAI